jgi:AcrR family transcriptional regulator
MTTNSVSNLNLTWAKKLPPSRGPKPTFSPDEIARVAIKVADAEGLEAVTMQRVAREIGVTTMALYRYFPGKAALVDLMIDSASDSASNFGRPSLQWDARLKRWARLCFAIYRDHPWFLEATSVRRSMMGPNELSWMEAALAMLAESGLSPGDRHSAFIAVISHVRGHASLQRLRDRNQSANDLAPILESEANRYPALLKALNSGNFSSNPARAFEFGLDCILDGIRSRVRRPKASSRRQA